MWKKSGLEGNCMNIAALLDLYRSNRNLSLNPSNLRRLQTEKLRNLIAHAYNNVPFYHEKFRNAGLYLSDIQNLNDLHKIPLTTKSEIQASPLDRMITRNVTIDKCVESRTSGSTGTPLRLISSKKTDSVTWNMLTRAYLKNGMRLRDKMMSVKDLSAHPVTYKSVVEYFGFMRKRYISIFDTPEVQMSFLAKEKPDIIESYPSTLVVIADACGSTINTRPRLIFTTAEFLDRQSRDIITKTFKAELFDHYASTEIGLMSWECRRHLDYHINADNVIMEFVDENNEPLSAGETGEIVCTNLNNYEMPLIRYAHGDAGQFVEGSCTCGIALPLMRMVGGRKDDFLQTTEGKIIPPTIFFPYPFQSCIGITQFRVIQERRDLLKFQLVLRESIKSEVFENARSEIRRVFGVDMEVEFETLDRLDREPSGKIRKVISRI
jgi:phenylacetate-CoA ligase